LFNQGVHFSSGLDITFGYEEMFVATMVARGFAVVVTDYEGLGTPGMHTYLNRASEGYALIDAARAAMRLPGTSLNPHGPVAFWGFSQGGGASASAAELAPTYAPDLDVVGAWANAPPADLSALLPFADGSVAVGLMGYLLNGLMAAYPDAEPAIRGSLTPQGEDLLNRTQDQCATEMVLTFAFHHFQEYFSTDPYELVAQEPLKSLLAEQKLGRYRPSAPVFIDQNRRDPLVAWVPSHQLALDWCAKGADIEFWTNEEPPFLNKTGNNHYLTYLVDGERGLQWIADRFNGLPTTPNCADI
jgi:triacylglycerol lipase